MSSSSSQKSRSGRASVSTSMDDAIKQASGVQFSQDIPDHLKPSAGKENAVADIKAKMDAAVEQAEAAAKNIPEPEETDREPPTIGQMLGDITWILTQSPLHKHFALSDLEWMVMPPLLLEQYRIFRDDDHKPVGVAFWAYLTPEVEAKLNAGQTRIMPQEWAVGARLDPERGMRATEGGTLWLMELITPGHTIENKLVERCLADLMETVFKGKAFKFYQHNPETGVREVKELEG